MPAVGLVHMGVTTHGLHRLRWDGPKVPAAKRSEQRAGSGEDVVVAGHDGLLICTSTEKTGNY